jgi:hypothetical protein
MRRAAWITGLLLAGLLLLVAMGALAEPPQWPPPEVTVQPRPDPAEAPPLPPAASAGTPAPVDAGAGTGWGLLDYAGALGTLLGTFCAGMGAYHVTCRPGVLELSRGPLDVGAIKAQLDRIEQRLEWIPAASPPSLSAPRPADLPAPLDPRPPTNTVVPL